MDRTVSAISLRASVASHAELAVDPFEQAPVVLEVTTVTVQGLDDGQADSVNVLEGLLDASKGFLRYGVASDRVLSELARDALRVPMKLPHESLKALVRSFLPFLIGAPPFLIGALALGIGVLALGIGATPFFSILLAVGAHFAAQVAELAQDRARSRVEIASICFAGHDDNLYPGAPSFNVLISIRLDRTRGATGLSDRQLAERGGLGARSARPHVDQVWYAENRTVDARA